MTQAGIRKKIAELMQSIALDDKETMRPWTLEMLNFLELLVSELSKLQLENQQLRDENNKLKGEQGKPKVRKQSKPNQDISSEEERKRNQDKKKRKSKHKKNKIKIDRVELCDVDKSQLPDDAKFQGYQSVIVQDLEIKTDNVEFKKKIYYSPSQKKSYMADLPAGYDGEFGPGIKALVIDFHYAGKMTEAAILTVLRNHGISISAATISRFITDNHDEFHQEKKDIVQAGMASSIHQQMDDTTARVKGKNYYTHILCNDLYTAYFTRRNKDRLTIIDILTQGEVLFHFNESSYSLMEQMHLPNKQLVRLRKEINKNVLNRAQADEMLKTLFPDPEKNITNRHMILEASAIIAYQQLPNAIEILLTDDAPQFKKITKLLGLCWVHDGRHYKKLNPVVPSHQNKLKAFLNDYWDYYHKLLDYKLHPTKLLAQSLEKEFDALFSITTGYDQLDERIKKTNLKKKSLLLVLTNPSLPLHNNKSELGARTQARYRDISYHTINDKGTQSKDTFMTLVETAKKLAVNSYHYFYDRFSKKYNMPSLASLIEKSTIEADIPYDSG